MADDREWTHDPLERSFFGTVGRGYLVGMVIFGLFGFLVARTQAPEWGTGAAIGMGVFVAVFAGILGGVVLIGLWAVKNEELIRGNETGHTEPPSVAAVGAHQSTADQTDDDATGAGTTSAEASEAEAPEAEAAQVEVVEVEVVEVEASEVKAPVEASPDAGHDSAT